MHASMHACLHACVVWLHEVTSYIASSRDPATRHLDGQFQLWTGENFEDGVQPVTA